MPNMSYCMFENTLMDLEQVYEYLEYPDHELSKDEQEAKLRLIDICVDIALLCGHEVGRNCEEVEA